jgi:hypothetical protein
MNKKDKTMKEDTLRNMIRNQIIGTLNEAPAIKTNVASSLSRVEKMAGVKMLKKALGTGGPSQQAVGLHAVVRAISGDNPATAKALARLLMKQGIDTPAPEEVDPTPSVEEARKISSSLSSKMGRLDKTSAMKMLRKTLSTKPASQQTDFVADLVKNLNLKGNITLLIKKIRQKN